VYLLALHTTTFGRHLGFGLTRHNMFVLHQLFKCHCKQQGLNPLAQHTR